MNIYQTLIENLDKISISLFQTIDMLFFSILISLIIGIPLGVFLATNNKSNVFKIIISFITNIIRSIPFMIFVIIMSPVTFLITGKSYGTQASKVPLTIIAIALIIRVTEQVISSLPKDLTKLSKAFGASKLQTIVNIYLPEVLPSLILGVTATIISVLSYSTIMGIISGGGLGDLAIKHALYEYNYNLLIIVVIVLILLVQVIQMCGNVLAFYLNKERFKGENKR